MRRTPPAERSRLRAPTRSWLEWIDSARWLPAASLDILGRVRCNREVFDSVSPARGPRPAARSRFIRCSREVLRPVAISRARTSPRGFSRSVRRCWSLCRAAGFLDTRSIASPSRRLNPPFSTPACVADRGRRASANRRGTRSVARRHCPPDLGPDERSDGV